MTIETQSSIIKRVQLALIALGYDLGPYGADGDFGRYTRNALAKYQADKGLAIKYPGTLGPTTLKSLGIETLDENTNTTNRLLDPPWVLEARKLLGLHEVKNSKTLDKLLRLDTSEIAWCGALCGYIIGATLPNEPLPTNPLGARNWTKFGHSTGIYLGAIAVFWRGTRNGWQGHVGTVVGHDKTAFHVLGGNQSNQVSIARCGKDRLLDLRWPITYPAPSGPELDETTLNQSLSINEA
jgi:uncharacterized protein (TIGR02594 family)